MAGRNGLDDLSRRLKRVSAEVKKAVTPALAKGGDEMASAMRALTPVKTGALRDSIVATPAGKSTPAHSQPGGARVVPEGAVVVTAGNSKVRYAHLVEYGTADGSAQPFFWPGYRLTKKRVRGRVNRALKAAIKAGWGS